MRHLATSASVLVLLAAGCGGDEDGEAARDGAPVSGKQGGKLTVLWRADVDSVDPGVTYSDVGQTVTRATQRALYAFEPDDADNAIPDLAEGQPEISADGRTVTVRIKRGVRFSPPVDREVTARDVKYAVERGFFRTVNNGYAGPYFGDLAGAEVGAEPGTKIAGIETPDEQTIVFRLRRPTAGTLAGALVLPLTAPVPEEYARRFDRREISTYAQHVVATGPYMLEADASGRAIGWEPGKRIRLVRNPNWNRELDFRPAYADEIDMPQGFNDSAVASRRILEGEGMISGDIAPPAAVMREALQSRRDQVVSVPGGGQLWIALNTKLAPFDDADVRRAVAAGFDRRAALLVSGGKYAGEVANHYIPPDTPGFDESGGKEGSGLDFLAAPEGDDEVAAEYFRRAGHASGRYEGDDEILMVGAVGGSAEKVAELAKEGFERLGFNVVLRLVSSDAMYTRFCGTPAAEVHVCPNVGWFKDFQDAQTVLDPPFHGDNIQPTNNVNWSQLDVPEIDRLMDEAATVTDPAERARAWAEVNRKVTEAVPGIPYQWDIQNLVRSEDVAAVANRQLGMWDLSFTALR